MQAQAVDVAVCVRTVPEGTAAAAKDRCAEIDEQDARERGRRQKDREAAHY